MGVFIHDIIGPIPLRWCILEQYKALYLSFNQRANICNSQNMETIYLLKVTSFVSHPPIGISMYGTIAGWLDQTCPLVMEAGRLSMPHLKRPAKAPSAAVPHLLTPSVLARCTSNMTRLSSLLRWGLAKWPVFVRRFSLIPSRLENYFNVSPGRCLKKGEVLRKI